jgi:hypothetical protein
MACRRAPAVKHSRRQGRQAVNTRCGRPAGTALRLPAGEPQNQRLAGVPLLLQWPAGRTMYGGRAGEQSVHLAV